MLDPPPVRSVASPASWSGGGRFASSESLDAGAFAPGQVLSGRYRIVGLVGRGGMGEVYRADDLKLGQPVALKFLPAHVAHDPVWLERFLAEVRNARQVSHPNVCRVYDVGEMDGRHFLSMEYVDGEDLASLLRRIGRLGGAKSLEIARQLCAGVAAAHDKGVLHRDLKPANVMLDGRGRIRITDFGLAGRVDERAAPRGLSGTPAYMAPELLAGEPASVRSDLYALGLVLYELFSGTSAFHLDTPAEWGSKHSQVSHPTSRFAPDLDPMVERVVLRCLEKDPRRRPPSALAVATSLPGGDPLAAALAAGETPSPEMVAAAGESGGLRPALAWTCLILVLVGLVGGVRLAHGSALLHRVPLDKSPDAMTERSRNVLGAFGYGERPADHARGYQVDRDYLDWLEKNDRSPRRWDVLARGRTPALVFWYRQSPRTLVPEGFLQTDILNGMVTPGDPPRTVSGMAEVSLAPDGRLVGLRVVPPQVTEERPSSPPEWAKLFGEAGLDPRAFRPDPPARAPEVYADTRAAWVEADPPDPKRALRVEAAAFQGKPVSFELIGPWSRPVRMQAAARSVADRTNDLIALGLFLALIVGSALVARRNVRLGRGDRRGAFLIAAVVFGVFLLAWAMAAHHVPALSEVGMFMLSASWSLFLAVLSWILYLALEPFARRRWPDTLIGWTRLLGGRWRDPLVGRDVIVGTVAGVLLANLGKVQYLVRAWVESVPPMPNIYTITPLYGPRMVGADLLLGLALSMLFSIAMFFLLFLFRIVLRREWLAGFVLAALIGAANWAQGGWITGVMATAVFGTLLWILVRFGLLAMVALQLASHAIQYPIPADLSTWYVPWSAIGYIVVVAMAVYGFLTATAGRARFGSLGLDD